MGGIVKPIETVFDDALANLKKFGWAKDNYFGPKGEMCLCSHMDYVLGERDSTVDGYVVQSPYSKVKTAYRLAREELFPGRVKNGMTAGYAAFNDHPDTTKADVEALLTLASQKMKSKGN